MRSKFVSKYDPEFRFLLIIDPAFEEWRVLATEWLSIQKHAVNKQAALVKLFVTYLHGQQLDKRPATLLDVHSVLPSLWESLDLSKYSELMGKRLHDYISDFIDWVLKEKFIKPDAAGHLVVPSQLRNPFPRTQVKQLGKMSDIEFRYLLNHDPQMEDWRALASEWLSVQRSCTNFRREALVKFLLTYILQHNQERNPYTFLRRDSLKSSFIDVHMATKRARDGSLVPRSSDIRMNNYVHDFLAWVLTKKLSVEDDGHWNIPHKFHNPIPRLSKSGMTWTETLKTPLPYRYIKELREMLAQGTTFRDWTWAQQAMESGTYGGDWFMIDPALVNTNDPDCVWRERKATLYERNTLDLPAKIVELWSPVRAVALYLKLELPLRTFQVVMLGSGEADTWRYESGKFRLNDSPLVIGTEKRPVQHGVFHRSSNEVGAGFFINTNKTADINKDEKHKGYIIPWTYEPVLYWLEKLRNWQEHYNPITAPMPWRELGVKHFGGTTPPHKAVLNERSDACFLFRDAAGAGSDRQKPLPSAYLTILWYQLLSKLEKRCADSHETLDDGSTIRFVEPNRTGNVTFYPLHALRVSLITAYALEGGVPFPVISKLIAGHARIIMTLYYTKAGKAHVTEVMQEAERRMLQNEAASHKRFLMEKTYQEIERRFAFVGSDAVNACQQQKSAAGFVIEDKGICPVGGSLCDLGGELIKDRATDKIYAPVSGYPQERNCVRCRFFLTGPAFLPGLQARFNEISYEATECSERYIRFEQKVKTLEDARSECEKRDRIFTQIKELERTYQYYEAEAEKANKLLTDLQACVRLISRCIVIANSTDEDGVGLVASGNIADIRYALTETTSVMHQLEVMCENAVIYPEVDASKASLRRSQILDAMMQMNARPPVFFRLSPDQQLKVGNEVMKLIQARSGSLKRAVEFAEGHRMLQELNVLEEVANVIEERTVGVGFRQVIDTDRTRKPLAKNIEKESDDES